MLVLQQYLELNQPCGRILNEWSHHICHCLQVEDDDDDDDDLEGDDDEVDDD